MQNIKNMNLKAVGRQLTRSVADELLFPKSAMPGMGTIEVFGKEQAVVHGCRGITEFDGETIILRMSDYLLKMTGVLLTVKSFSAGCADITGNISSFEFLGG